MKTLKPNTEHRPVVARDERAKATLLEEQALLEATVGRDERDTLALEQIGKATSSLRGGCERGRRRPGQSEDGRGGSALDATVAEPDVAAALVT